MENVRWLTAVMSALREIDSNLDLYEDAFGPGADSEADVQVLQETRDLLVRLVGEYPLPTATLALSLQQQGADAIAGWRRAAADRRIVQFRGDLEQLAKAVKELHVISPYFERLMSWDPADDVRVPFANRLERTRMVLGELEAEFAVAAESRPDLETLLGFEQRHAMVAYQVLILDYWQATSALQQVVNEHDIGDRDDQLKWGKERDRLRSELEAAFDKPDFKMFDHLRSSWESSLETMRSDIEHTAQIEGLKGLLIDLAALLITKKLGGLRIFRGLSVVRLTLFETVTLTAVSSVGRSAVMPGKRIDPSAMLNGLVDTFAAFGVLGIVNNVTTEGALRYLRGRPIAQLSMIFGVNTLAATGLPVVVAHMANPDDPSWKDRDASLVLHGLIINGFVGALSLPGTLRSLEAMKPLGLHTEVVSLRADTLEYLRNLGAAYNEGPLGPRQWSRMQSRGVRLVQRTQRTIERLADLPDETLSQLGEAKTALRQHAKDLGAWGTFIAGIKQDTSGRLELPTELMPGELVPRGTGVYEYNPKRPQSSTEVLTRRFEKGGYKVKNEAGVLLLSTGADAPSSYRLLPAASPTPGRVVSAESASARRLLLDAAGPGEAGVGRVLDGPTGEALLAAAQLEPELVRRVVLSEPADERAALQRLERALHDDGLAAGDRNDAFTQKWLERALQGAGSAASARRAATAAGPHTDLLALGGGGSRAREVLATSDGRALVEAATLAPSETRVAVILSLERPELDRLEDTWRERGLPADRVSPARHALDALLRAKADVPLTAVEEIVAAVGSDSSARSDLEALERANPGGYRALLEAFAREPALVRRAIRASESRTRANALSELARRLHPTWIPDEEILAVGDTIVKLNKARFATATSYQELEVRATAVRAVRDVDALRSDAQVVIGKFRDARRNRATPWLGAGLGNEAAELGRRVNDSPALQEIAASGGGTTLRQLWTMFRAGRTRAPKLLFEQYVEKLQSTHQVGLHGEYQFAFWAGKKFIVIKAPDAGVTVGGTDIILIPRGGGPPIWVDQKAVEGVVSDVSALMRNLPQNVAADLAMMDALVASGREFPQELLTALPLQREANRRIESIVHPGGRPRMTKAEVESPSVQTLIDAELKKLGIRRVIGTFAGDDTYLAAVLRQIGFEDWPGDD